MRRITTLARMGLWIAGWAGQGFAQTRILFAERRVLDLFHAQRLEAGTHRLPLELSAPTGIHFLRLSSPEGVLTRKLTLVR